MQATALGINVFLEYISWLKSLELHVEYIQEDDGWFLIRETDHYFSIKNLSAKSAAILKEFSRMLGFNLYEKRFITPLTFNKKI